MFVRLIDCIYVWVMDVVLIHLTEFYSSSSYGTASVTP